MELVLFEIALDPVAVEDEEDGAADAEVDDVIEIEDDFTADEEVADDDEEDDGGILLLGSNLL